MDRNNTSPLLNGEVGSASTRTDHKPSAPILEGRLSPRDVEIVNLWVNEDRSSTYIAKHLGIQPKTVMAVVDRAGVKNVPRKKRSRKFSEQKPISALHAQIGHDINHNRTFKAKMSAEGFASQVKMSHLRLRKIEMGFEEPTLSELIRFAKALGMTIEALTTLRNRVA